MNEALVFVLSLWGVIIFLSCLLKVGPTSICFMQLNYDGLHIVLYSLAIGSSFFTSRHLV
uniref:Uncharacterized protein n=1 Tax=Arundo donax TaxID=35708 RepID=A0A0A8YXR2_ARUDO